MRNENLTYEDVLRIVELVKSTQFSEFRLKVGEIEVHLRRANGAAPQQHAAPPPAAITVAPEAASAPRGIESHFADDAVLVRSPMVGTFYRSPSPGAPSFVEVGQAVEANTTVCIIEVMKLMNSIPAGARGVVRQILVSDAEMVEYGQALIVVEPR